MRTERTPTSAEGSLGGPLSAPAGTSSQGGWVYGGVAPPESLAAFLPRGGGRGPPTWGSELSGISVKPLRSLHPLSAPLFLQGALGAYGHCWFGLVTSVIDVCTCNC